MEQVIYVLSPDTFRMEDRKETSEKKAESQFIERKEKLGERKECN